MLGAREKTTSSLALCFAKSSVRNLRDDSDEGVIDSDDDKRPAQKNQGRESRRSKSGSARVGYGLPAVEKSAVGSETQVVGFVCVSLCLPSPSVSLPLHKRSLLEFPLVLQI